MTWLEFTIAGLATYRLAVLLSDDSGPYRFLSRFRAFLKREAKVNRALRKSDVAAGVDCLRCSSVWLAGPVAVYVITRRQLPEWLTIVADLLLLWMALSAVAILINRIPKR